MQGTGAQAVLEVIRERERVMWRTVREGLKIGGVIAVGVGLGLLAFLRSLHNAPPAGYLPLSVGIALLVYSLFLAPKDR